MRKESNGALYLNIRGVYPKSNRTKIDYIRDLASQSESAFIVMTETHLSPDILDAEVAIQGYTSYRADRAEPRTHGGSMVYVRNDLASQLVASHSNGYCETVVVQCRTLDTLVLCVYRPPDCKLAQFREALEVCQTSINNTMKEHSKVRNFLLFGDFNFPCISWPSRQIYSQQGRVTKSDDKKQAELLLDFSDENFLENCVETPTRGKNILDLVFSNNHSLINYYKTIVNKSLSDHFIIEVLLNFSYNQQKKDEKVKNPYSTKAFEYDTKNADDEDWLRFDNFMQQKDSDLDKDKEFEKLNSEEQLKKMHTFIEEGLELCIKKKEDFKDNKETEDPVVSKKPKNFIPRAVRNLMRKKVKLSNKVLKSKNWDKNYKVMLEIEVVEEELKTHYLERRKNEEKKAVNALFSDPKYFYSYEKKFSKTLDTIACLEGEGGSMVTDSKEQADLLLIQYESVASQPREEFIVKDGEEFFQPAGPAAARGLEGQDGEPAAAQGPAEQGREHAAARGLEGQNGEPAAAQGPDEQGGEHEAARGLEHEAATNSPTLDMVVCDWKDFSEAIDSIPGGASCGPDGIPAIVLKRAKVPMARMICKIFQTSMETGEIPASLKSAFIKGTYKGGGKTKPVNYRPISLTSHVMKTMERVLRKALVSFMDFHSLMDHRQHGSRAGRSTLSQLLQHQDEILEALETGDNMDVIYLDFSKAFDKVDHGILLHKIRSLGITGKVGRWIMSFLQKRIQQVMIRSQKSDISILKSGVPQGSVLGPLLFLIFISDMGKDLLAIILLYVDDSKVKDKIKTEEDVTRLQDNLNEIFKWEESNNMKFNGDKFQILRYGDNNQVKEDTLYYTGNMEHVIEEVDRCRDLGVIMENTGSFNAHIEKVCKKVRQKCGWILRTFFTRDQKFLRHMFNTLVQPHIDFSSQLWAPAEGPEMDKIEQLLRNFTAKLPSVKHLPYWERLKALKMNSEQRRIERYKIIYTWKVLQGYVPNCGIEASSTEERLGRKCRVPILAKKSKEISTKLT